MRYEVRQSTLKNVYPDRNQIVLETEVTNAGSLRLYERLGFIRSKRLHRYYLNGNTAFRLGLGKALVPLERFSEGLTPFGTLYA